MHVRASVHPELIALLQSVIDAQAEIRTLQLPVVVVVADVPIEIGVTQLVVFQAKVILQPCVVSIAVQARQSSTNAVVQVVGRVGLYYALARTSIPTSGHSTRRNLRLHLALPVVRHCSGYAVAHLLEIGVHAERGRHGPAARSPAATSAATSTTSTARPAQLIPARSWVGHPIISADALVEAGRYAALPLSATDRVALCVNLQGAGAVGVCPLYSTTATERHRGIHGGIVVPLNSVWRPAVIPHVAGRIGVFWVFDPNRSRTLRVIHVREGRVHPEPFSR